MIQIQTCVQACINSYNGGHGECDWKIFDKPVEWFHVENTDGYFGYRDEVLYIVFQGSKGAADWNNNFKIDMVDFFNYGCKIHNGFLQEYSAVREMILKKIDENKRNYFVITGHSLGGALAEICGYDIVKLSKGFLNPDVMSFGAPALGNRKFMKDYNNLVKNCSWRVVNGDDIVSKVVPKFFGARQVDNLLRVGKFHCWKFWGSIEDHYPELYKKNIDGLIVK